MHKKLNERFKCFYFVGFSTLMAPTIITIEIKIVIHVPNAIIALRVSGESHFKKIDLCGNSIVNSIINETIKDNIVPTPVTIEPIRSDRHRQQLCNIGPAMFVNVIIMLVSLKHKNH